MEMRSAANPKFNLKQISDDRLFNLLENTESELSNKATMTSYPQHAKTIRDHYKMICKEIHRRKLNLCLTELEEAYEFKKTKRQFVIRWLKEINIQDIEPLEPSPVK